MHILWVSVIPYKHSAALSPSNDAELESTRAKLLQMSPLFARGVERTTLHSLPLYLPHPWLHVPDTALVAGHLSSMYGVRHARTMSRSLHSTHQSIVQSS